MKLDFSNTNLSFLFENKTDNYHIAFKKRRYEFSSYYNNRRRFYPTSC